MNTDESLGCSVMAYLAPWVLSRHCEAGKSILARVEGRASRMAKAGRSNVPQWTKVGYCPFRAVPAHVAAPPPYGASVFDPLEARGMDRWSQFGDWAGRSLSASHYT